MSIMILLFQCKVGESNLRNIKENVAESSRER